MTFVRLAFVVALVSRFVACHPGDAATPSPFQGETMGTTYTVQVSEMMSESERLVVARAIEETLESVNHKMSNYREDSELSRLNRAAAGEAITVSPETFDVLFEAQRISELTQGAFDVTVAPLVSLWGFGPGAGASEPPSQESIDRAKSRVGYRNLVVDDDARTITKKAEGLECDLSAIAKGYAVDRVAERLKEQGIQNFMVEVGGEVRTLGKNAKGQAWQIGVEKPVPGTRALERIVPLSGLAMATSGDYRNFYEVEGKLYSHLIDPRLGRPVEHHLASVSVIDETCMRADALASGLLVLGPEEGFDLAVQQDLTVLFLIRSETGEIEERATPAFQQFFSGMPKMGS
jgi:thiamine biosynthesis lipoprotein